MAKRFTDTEKWKKPFIKGLPSEYKLFWLYLIDDCDHSGIWHMDLEVAEIRLGIKLSVEKIRGLFASKVVEFDGGTKLFIPDFISFQYGILNEENRAHNSVINQLKKYNLLSHIELKSDDHKPLTSPLQGAMDKDKDMDKDKVKVEDSKVKKNRFPTYNKQLLVKAEWEKLKSALPEEVKETKEQLSAFITEQKPDFLEPYAYVWNMFAQENGLSQMEAPTDERVKKIKIRVAEPGFDFFKILLCIKKSSFLKGGSTQGWKVDFNYIIANNTNYIEILEGKYS
jgi:hypothetical protein